MKNLLTILFATFFFSTAFAQVSKTTTQTLTASGVSTVNLDLQAADIEIVETKGSRIIIEARISLDNLNNMTLLEFLINSGRYDLENVIDNSTKSLTIKRKKNNNALIVRGTECKETLRYKILIPSSIKFVKQTTTTASK